MVAYFSMRILGCILEWDKFYQYFAKWQLHYFWQDSALSISLVAMDHSQYNIVWTMYSVLCTLDAWVISGKSKGMPCTKCQRQPQNIFLWAGSSWRQWFYPSNYLFSPEPIRVCFHPKVDKNYSCKLQLVYHSFLLHWRKRDTLEIKVYNVENKNHFSLCHFADQMDLVKIPAMNSAENWLNKRDYWSAILPLHAGIQPRLSPGPIMEM